MSQSLTLFTDIENLLTFSRAAKKQGRNPKEKDLSLVKDGAFAVDKGHFVWVGQRKEIPHSIKRKAQKVSLFADSVLPSFIECHTHLVYGGSRSHEFEMRNQGATYQEIAQKGGGIQSTVKDTRKATLNELIYQGQKNVNLFLKQGVTTIEVKSGYALNLNDEIKMLQAISELKKARIISTFLALHAVPSEFKNADEYIKNVIHKVLPEVSRKKLAHRVDAFVEKGYFTPKQSEAFFKAAKELGLSITAHVEQLSHSKGTQMAEKLFAQSVDHLVQINNSDIQILAKSKSTCVLLPSADFYLNMAYPPARKLIDHGACVALATDYNPGSSPTPDLSFVGVLARMKMKMSLPEVLVGYTFNAAKALGLEQKLGSIENQKEADFVVFNSSWKDLFYQVGHLGDIRSVWMKGKPIRLPQ